MLYINFYFFLYKSRTRKDGKSPIYGRITDGRKRKQFSANIFINPSNWNAKAQRLNKSVYNNLLLQIRAKVEAEIINSHMEGKPSVEEVYKRYRTDLNSYTLLVGIRDFLAHVQSLIGIDYTKSTYDKYSFIEKQIEAFLKETHRAIDLPVKDVDRKFLLDLEHYFKTVMKYKDQTTHKAMQRFRTVIGYFLKQEIIEKNPFANYSFPKYEKEIIHLSESELQRLEEIELDGHLESVRKVLVFICYTGMGYSELKNFTKSDIESQYKVEYININRVKTGKSYIVPLLAKSKEILEHFDYELPVQSNQKMNVSLKKVIPMIGISSSNAILIQPELPYLLLNI